MSPTKKDMKFEWAPEMELFVVRQFAEFVNPLQIALNLMQIYYDECEPDLTALTEQHGKDDAKQLFGQFLLSRIWNLSPRQSKFPKMYVNEYNTFRTQYLNDMDACYLTHSRNRMRELDKLFAKAEGAITAHTKPTDIRACTMACLEIIKESRAESNKTQVNASFTNEEGNIKISMHTYLASLPQEEVLAIKGKIERGEPVELPNTVESGHQLNPAENGSGQRTSETQGSGGSTKASTDPTTEG